MVTRPRRQRSSAKTVSPEEKERKEKAAAAAERTEQRKTTASRSRQGNVRFIESKQVDPLSLTSYEKNPRKGNVRAVCESLMEHGQYRPILVRTHDGGGRVRVPTILAGNHTWKAVIYLNQVATEQAEKPQWIVDVEKRTGRKLKPWPKVAIVTVDATDDEAARMVLADNRTADLGGYDAGVLHELIGSLPDAHGTGYTQEEFEMITKASTKSAAETVKLIEDNVQNVNLIDEDDEDYLDLIPMADVPALNLNKPVKDDDEDEYQPLIDEDEELKSSITQLNDDVVFPGVGYMDIPPLRPDMMIEELPDNLTTWSGSATKDWPDEDVYWLYNYGIDSTSGMKPGKPIMLSFYTWDEYFETWWLDTAKRTAQALNTKPPVQLAIAPNFSQGEMPMTMSYYSLYRSRYVARYMQEAGIRVMPDLQFRADKKFAEHAKASLPNDLKWGALQVQNLFSESRSSGLDKDAEIKLWEKHTELMFNTIRPENVLVYATDAGWLRIQEFVHDRNIDVKLRFQPTRMALLSEAAKGREKKVGLN